MGRSSRAFAPLPLALLLVGCGSVKLPFGLFEPGRPPVAVPVEGLQWGDPLPDVSRRDAKDPSYQIGPEDALEISVWKDDTLKSTTLVRPDGGISFPLVGELTVAGKTTTQVRDELAKRLEKYVPEPVVTVSVARVASYRIYVLGRVAKPGEYPVGRPVDVLQALSLAGGTTPFAVEDEIRVIRKVNGQAVTLPFDYARLRKRGDLSQNIMLKSGDVLLVP